MIRYAGEQYSAEQVQRTYGFDPREFDLSREQPWENFVEQVSDPTAKAGGLVKALADYPQCPEHSVTWE